VTSRSGSRRHLEAKRCHQPRYEADDTSKRRLVTPRSSSRRHLEAKRCHQPKYEADDTSKRHISKRQPATPRSGSRRHLEAAAGDTSKRQPATPRSGTSRSSGRGRVDAGRMRCHCSLGRNDTSSDPHPLCHTQIFFTFFFSVR